MNDTDILNRIDNPPLCNHECGRNGREECDEFEWNPFSGKCEYHDPEYGMYDPTENEIEYQDPDEWRDYTYFACDDEI